MTQHRVAARTVRDHVMRGGERAPVMERPVRLTEVDRIARIEDDRFRALRIALGHHDVSRRYGDMLEARFGRREAIWCSYAVWSTLSVHRVLARSTTVERAGPRGALLGGALHALGGARIADDVLDQLGEGNRDVFVEIASELLRVADEIDRHHRAAPDRIRWDRWVRRRVRSHVRGVGFLPGDRALLHEGVSHYFDAMFEHDPEVRSAMILAANLLLGEYEQRRLQWRLQRALAIAGERHPSSLRPGGRWPRWHGDRARLVVNQYYARIITQHALVWESPLGGFRPGVGLPVSVEKSRVPLPTCGVHPAADRAHQLLARWIRPVAPGSAPAVDDWTCLDQRMAYIAALFVHYQREPAFLAEPFGPRLTELIEDPERILDGPGERTVRSRVGSLVPEPVGAEIDLPDGVAVAADVRFSVGDRVWRRLLARLVVYYDAAALVVPEGAGGWSAARRVAAWGEMTTELVAQGSIQLIERPGRRWSPPGPVPPERGSEQGRRGLVAVADGRIDTALIWITVGAGNGDPDADPADPAGSGGRRPGRLTTPCPVMPVPTDPDAATVLELAAGLGDRARDHRHKIEHHLASELDGVLRLNQLERATAAALDEVLAPWVDHGRLLPGPTTVARSGGHRALRLDLAPAWLAILRQEATVGVDRLLDAERGAAATRRRSGRAKPRVAPPERSALIDRWLAAAVDDVRSRLVDHLDRVAAARGELDTRRRAMERELRWDATKLMLDLDSAGVAADGGVELALEVAGHPTGSGRFVATSLVVSGIPGAVARTGPDAPTRLEGDDDLAADVA
ncbi:MAG: hypothetical protein ACFCVK_18310 [Acidimicrobiales bacterium]